MDHPFGLATNGDQLFWTDWTTMAVYGAERNSGTNAKKLVAHMGKPMDVIAIASQISGEENICSQHNNLIFKLLFL